jgi:hypothetical protein
MDMPTTNHPTLSFYFYEPINQNAIAALAEKSTLCVE